MNVASRDRLYIPKIFFYRMRTTTEKDFVGWFYHIQTVDNPSLSFFHSFNLKIRLNLWFGWFHGTLCLTSMRILKRLWSYGRFLKRHAEKIFIKNVKGFTRVWKNRFYFCKMIMCEYTLIPEWWRVLYDMIQCVNYKKYYLLFNSAWLLLYRALLL